MHTASLPSLNEKQLFKGVVNILGEPYITEYSPMHNAQGELIGAYFVGNQVNMQVLKESIETTYFLKHGFIAVMETQSQKVLFNSNNISTKLASNIIQSKDNNWRFVTRMIPEWQFKIIVAYPIGEAQAESFQPPCPLLAWQPYWVCLFAFYPVAIP